MSKWANIDTLKARIDEDVREDKVLDGWAFFFRVYLDSAPTIELKHGEWMNKHENGHGEWVGTCNQCNNIARVSNFCPNCGAIMIDDVFVKI